MLGDQESRLSNKTPKYLCWSVVAKVCLITLVWRQRSSSSYEMHFVMLNLVAKFCFIHKVDQGLPEAMTQNRKSLNSGHCLYMHR